MKRKLWRILYELAVLALSVVLLGTLLFRLGYWLMPERTVYGSVWTSYLQEEEDSVDILFLGSSRVYCDVIPAVIYEETGATSFVNAGPSQTASLTYYYLRESLRTQHPKYVFVEASAAYFGINEDHSKTNVCYMPGSFNRVLAGAACEEGILELALYPLQEFHYRIYDKADEKPPEQDGTMLCGYTPLSKAVPQTERKFRIPNVEPGNEKYLYNLDYFRQIAELCQENGIACVFFVTPTMQDYTEAQSERLVSDLRALPCLAVEDWTDLIQEIGIDNETDWYDSLHFNQNGAVKFTRFLCGYLSDLGVEPTPGADEALWQARLAYLNLNGSNSR